MFQKKKHAKARVGIQHKVSTEEAMNWYEDTYEYGDIIGREDLE